MAPRLKQPIIAFAAFLVGLLLYAGCSNFKPGSGQLPASEQISTILAKEKQPPCPSFSGMSLSNIAFEALPYLKKYAVPTTDATEFCRYLERLQQEHESKIEEGLIDMMGDYFWATQTIETNYFFSYKLGRPS
ncbi:MAG: hypothetical protein EXQ58_12355, partial [Acidobacteria bacterium]|nr:hypothetical protein [Acidobacteriota bacterium]